MKYTTDTPVHTHQNIPVIPGNSTYGGEEGKSMFSVPTVYIKVYVEREENEKRRGGREGREGASERNL